MKYILIDLERSLRRGIIHYWKPNNRGYTTDPSEAGHYDAIDAGKEVHDDYDGNTISIGSYHFEKLIGL